VVAFPPDPPPLTERFLAAVALANELHGRDRRSGTQVPYMAHLLTVTGLVIEDGGDENQAIAALLHDAVEDGGGRPLLERIHRSFGARVAEIVESLSDTLEPGSGEPWIDRKVQYLARLEQCTDDEILRVGLADKVHNARSIVRECRDQGPALWERSPEKTAAQQLWYYSRLADLFTRKRPGPLTEDLGVAVRELTALIGD